MNKQAPFLNLAWNPNSATKIDICYSEMLNKSLWAKYFADGESDRLIPICPTFMFTMRHTHFLMTSHECVFTIRLLEYLYIY